ncbi:MAG TPA: ATP-binding protein [Bryobacteraceae bacterium]|nr:ATP-binding protein [Bryobacteraceae bacterium]
MLRILLQLVKLVVRNRTVLAALAALILTLLTYRALAGRERAQVARTTALAGEAVESGLTAELALRMRPIERMSRRWTISLEAERGDWEDRASQFAAVYPGFQSIEWVDASLHVRWFGPQFGNAALADFDYSNRPEVRSTLLAARERRATRATAVHELPQGGQGFLVAAPVVRGSRIEGYIAGSFRCTELLYSVLDRAVPRGYSAEVSQGGKEIYRHPRDAAPWTGRIRDERMVDIYGVPWRVRVWPNAQSLLELSSSLPGLFLAAGLLISLLVTLSVQLSATASARSRELEIANQRLAGEIADRRRAAEALRHANDTLKAIIDTSPVAIVSCLPDGIVTGWNAAAEGLLGWSEQEALGRELAERGGEELGQWRIRARAGQPVRGVECTVQRRDGQTVSSDLWIARQPSAGGRDRGLICLLADTGPRKLLEQRLRDSYKLDAVSRLAAGIAHNFNNLLAIITGYSHMALANSPPGDPMRAEIEEVLRAADRAARLTVQLLAFGRGQPISPVVVDLNTVVENLREVLQKIAGDGYEILVPLGADVGKVRIDPQQVEQILVTLVVNARDAMPGGGRIAIETARAEVRDDTHREHLDVPSGLYVVLSVTDKGPGMDDETRRHLFEPFFTTKGLGTFGLGLSSVYGVAKQNGGGVAAISRPGWGTRIEVYLPRV